MPSYKFRKNVFVTAQDDRYAYNARVAFTTKERDWVDRVQPLVVLLSIHCAFHEGVKGQMQMETLIKTIEETVQGKATYLIAEYAHLHVIGLKHKNPEDLCITDAQKLLQRFQPFFEELDVRFWRDFVLKDPYYATARSKVLRRYHTDTIFRSLLVKDAESTYTPQREREYPDRELFLEKAALDIMEQCVAMSIMIHRGYRWMVYPGRMYECMEHLFEGEDFGILNAVIRIQNKKKKPLRKIFLPGQHQPAVFKKSSNISIRI